jgi:hypothetical protein
MNMSAGELLIFSFCMALGAWLMTEFIDFAKPYFGDWYDLLLLVAMVVCIAPLALGAFLKQTYDRIRNDKMELDYFRERERKAREAEE